MEIHNLLDIKSRAELREWLIQNHKTEKECWVVVKRGRPTDDNTFWYIDAVEEALCFGWIDSTTKKIANEITVQKLCPRKPRSNWSELNKERCRRMERLGLMTDAGRAVLPDMSPSGFTIDKDLLQRLHSDPVVWNNFCQFPDLYKRIRIDTIQIKRKQPELFESQKIREKDFSMENGMIMEDYGLHNHISTLTNTGTHSMIFLQSASSPFHKALRYTLMKHCLTPS